MSETSTAEPETNDFTIGIHPVPLPRVAKDEQLKRAEALADELRKVGGVKVTVPVRGAAGPILHIINPIIFVSILGNVVGSVLEMLVSEMFARLRESRDKLDH